MTDTTFMLILDILVIIAVLSLAGLCAEWLSRYPQSALTRRLDKWFRRAGF